jgi:hypothetical protein
MHLRPPRGAFVASTIALLLAATSTAAADSLHYGAYLAGAQIGQGEVHIHVAPGSYTISGEAWALGILKTATHWRSDFSASGRIDSGEVVPETYEFTTSRRGNRSRTTRIVDGVVKTYRDGRPRRTAQAPDGLDVLTALFFAGSCDALEALHSGTSTYQLQLRSRETPASDASADFVERCEFEVIDEDGDGYVIDIRLGEHNGHRVPLRIDVGGFISGSVRLLEVEQRTAQTATATATAGR